MAILLSLLLEAVVVIDRFCRPVYRVDDDDDGDWLFRYGYDNDGDIFRITRVNYSPSYCCFNLLLWLVY